MLKRQKAKYSCTRCYWFQMSKTKPCNRGCMYPEKIELLGARCKMWRNCYSRADRFLALLHVKQLPVRSFIE